jgi:hypothetical protein
MTRKLAPTGPALCKRDRPYRQPMHPGPTRSTSSRPADRARDVRGHGPVGSCRGSTWATGVLVRRSIVDPAGGAFPRRHGNWVWWLLLRGREGDGPAGGLRDRLFGLVDHMAQASVAVRPKRVSSFRLQEQPPADTLLLAVPAGGGSGNRSLAFRFLGDLPSRPSGPLRSPRVGVGRVMWERWGRHTWRRPAPYPSTSGRVASRTRDTAGLALRAWWREALSLRSCRTARLPGQRRDRARRGTARPEPAGPEKTTATPSMKPKLYQLPLLLTS